METIEAPQFVVKMRRWLSKSRAYSKIPIETSDSTPIRPFHFLSLPREIRNMIYRELLLSTYPLIIHLRCVYWFEHGTQPHNAILRTNRQIHDEAAAILYGENTWFSAAPLQIFPWGDVRQGSRSVYDLPPGPSPMYLSWIKRFVLFPDGPPHWLRDKVFPAGDINSMMSRLGIKRELLTHFAVGCLSVEMSDNVIRANEDSLQATTYEDMKQRFEWFSLDDPKPAHWLIPKSLGPVLKKEDVSDS